MKDKIPCHIGIIMDGNGRWATSRGYARSRGHKEGAEALKKIIKHANELHLPYLSVFAFSTENFKRDAKEVNYLMNLFVRLFKSELDFLIEDQVKVVFSGRREPLPKKVLDAMDIITKKTKDNRGMVLNVCLNYGGKTEIVDMVKRIAMDVENKKITIDQIDISLVDHAMYQDLPPLDLVIRTSGEYRISNFMLYQASYAEFYFSPKYFPDFTPRDLDIAIEDYGKRNRRFGGIKK